MAKYDDIDLVPPKNVREAARKGLEMRREHGRGGLDSREAGQQNIKSGVVRASTLERGLRVSVETIRAMVRFFSRTENYKNAKGSKATGFWGDYNNPSAGFVAHHLWGGDPGERCAKRKLKEIERVDAK